MSIRRRSALSAIAGALASPFASRAQESKELKIVVPTGAGGPVDGLARVIGERLAPLINQPVVVDNRSGAAGQIAAAMVARSPGNSNMMLLGSLGIMSMSPHLYPNLPYDVGRDFAPVILCARVPLALLVNPNVVPVSNVQEFKRWARQQSGPVPFGTFGSGSVSHIAAEMLAADGGFKTVQVPYRDQPRIFSDLVKGDLPAVFEPPAGYLDYVKEGKLRIVGLTSSERSKAFPDLPTMQEMGLPGFEFSNWFGLFLPARVAPAALQRLRTTLQAVVGSERFRDHFLSIGLDATGAATENFPEMVSSEYLRWQAFARKHDIKLTT